MTEENLTEFVNCIKDYVSISIFNKNYNQKAVEACRYLSILRPELIIPTINLFSSVFASIDNMTEPHCFTSIINCLTSITRQLVRQTSTYSHGQTYIIHGIDLNDYKKTIVTLDFYNAIFKLIICVDCSSAIHIRNDLTEVKSYFVNFV